MDPVELVPLDEPQFLLDGQLIVFRLHTEGRMLPHFYASDLFGENGRWYHTDKGIDWYKNYVLYASDEWLVTPKMEGKLAAVSLRTDETRVIGYDTQNSTSAGHPISSERYLAFLRQEGDSSRLYLYEWESGETTDTGFSVIGGGDHTSLRLGAVDESGRVLVNIYCTGAESCSVLVSPPR